MCRRCITFEWCHTTGGLQYLPNGTLNTGMHNTVMSVIKVEDTGGMAGKNDMCE